MKYLALLLAALASTTAMTSQAQALKPGLWELKQTPQLDATRQAKLAQAQKAMENMAPDQRAMLEQMLAQRGISMNMAGGSISLKTCITKEQAERNLSPVAQHGNCTQDVQRSNNVLQVHFSCTDPASDGDATVTLHGTEAFTNDVTVRRPAQGRTETVKVSGEGRWLGVDCGTVQPLKTQVKP